MTLSRFRLQGWITPAALFGVVLLSYGLWIPWMGLFGNDVPYLYYYHLLGPWGPGQFASLDRPISALFYAVVTALFGETVWSYHVLLLILRWLSAVLFWWVLGQVWPERKREAGLAAVLFAVYPGFRQSPVALEFILHIFVLDLFLLSLGATLLAASRPRQFWVWSLVNGLGAAGLFFLEYFAGLEILRPIFLWIITRRAGLTGRTQVKRILAAWAPALVVSVAFFIWRVFVFSFPTYKPVLLDQLRTQPLAGLVGLAHSMVRDVWTAFGAAWLQTLNGSPAGTRALFVYLALAAAGGGLVYWLYRSQPDSTTAQNPRYWGETALGIGLLAMLAGGSIFWVTGIDISLAFPWDRATLSLMLGASLALTGLLEMAISVRYRPLVAATLVALAVGMHFVNAQIYRAEWQKLQDFAWQLTWRAPRLEPGSLLLFDVIPLDRYSDNDLTALVNWIYAPELHSAQIDYKFFDLTLRLDSEYSGLPGVDKDLPVEVHQRGLIFKSSTSNTVALTYDPPDCLKILDPNQVPLPGLAARLVRVLPMTRLSLISAVEPSAHLPAQLGAEPKHGWCYYFQKADLAHQQQDWPTVAALGDQAEEANLHTKNPAELLPFIEGYALTGNMARATELSARVSEKPDLQPALCAAWERVREWAGADQAVAAGAQSILMGCLQP